jgi:hypothetical protein
MIDVRIPCDSGYTQRGEVSLDLSPVEKPGTLSVSLGELPPPYCGQPIDEWADYDVLGDDWTWGKEAFGYEARIINAWHTVDCAAYRTGLSDTAEMGMRCQVLFDVWNGVAYEDMDKMVGGWRGTCADAGMVFYVDTPATTLEDQRVVHLCRKSCHNHDTWNGCKGSRRGGTNPLPLRCCDQGGLRDIEYHGNYCRLVDAGDKCPFEESFRATEAEDEGGLDVGVIVAIAGVAVVCCCAILACAVLALVRVRAASSRRPAAKVAATSAATAGHHRPASRRSSVSRTNRA